MTLLRLFARILTWFGIVLVIVVAAIIRGVSRGVRVG